MAILDALGLKAVGLKRRLFLPSLVSRIFIKNRAERRVISPFFVIFPLFILCVSLRGNPMVTMIQGAVLDIVSPLVCVLQKPMHWASEMRHFFASKEELQREISKLKQQNDVLRLSNIALKQVAFLASDGQSKIEFMKGLREQDLLHKRYDMATVLNQPTFGQPLFLGISQAMNLEKGDIVLGAKGLIGRISQKGSKTAMVTTLFDGASRIPVEVKGTQGIVTGAGEGVMKLSYVKDAHFDGKIGDVAVTSGFGGIYPKGLPVGVIAHIEPGKILIRPFEDLKGQHTVVVLKSVDSLPQESYESSIKDFY